MSRSTIESRRKLWSALSKRFDAWMKMTDDQLLREAQGYFPALTEATRDECFKILVMDHTHQMVEEVSPFTLGGLTKNHAGKCPSCLTTLGSDGLCPDQRCVWFDKKPGQPRTREGA